MNIETLYQSYSRDVFRFALYLSGNWEDAEDITAETFVRAWVAEESIRLATVKGYLFAIARNLFLQECGRRPAIRNSTKKSPTREEAKTTMLRNGKSMKLC